MNLIRATEAAKILGVRRETVWRWVKAGKLSPALVIGDETFFDRAYIEKHAASKKAEVAA